MNYAISIVAKKSDFEICDDNGSYMLNTFELNKLPLRLKNKISEEC